MIFNITVKNLSGIYWVHFNLMEDILSGGTKTCLVHWALACRFDQTTNQNDVYRKIFPLRVLATILVTKESQPQRFEKSTLPLNLHVGASFHVESHEM